MSFGPGTIFKHYRIERLIGKGGMGEVYLAEETTLGRKVAIKVLKQEATTDPRFVERFRNEARVLGQLNHPNIVGLLTFFEEAGIYYLVMQYAPGITLAELIRRTGPIPEQRAMRIFAQLAEALTFAHSEGVVHRDIKPSNIMVDPDKNDRVMVMDFGIARLIDAQHITRTGTQLGTPCYMSPEQVLGKKEVGPPSDVYSAGVVLYEMLSGTLPYDLDTESLYTIQDRILKEPLPDPRMRYEYISDKCVSLVRDLTQKEADKRPTSYVYKEISSYQAASPNARAQIASLPGMIQVNGGTFIREFKGSFFKRNVQNTVSVSSFLIGKHPVTQREWQDVMGSNPSFFKGDELPVESVTWYDAIEYCNKRSIKEGLKPCYSRVKKNIICDWSANGYRLPTEAEWEFAARGGNQSNGYSYSGSNDLDSVAWYQSNSNGITHRVGTKSPNELGIYDMSGNVWEWCWDWCDNYASASQNDPKGATSGISRVLRGGSWNCNDYNCRVAFRSNDDPGFRNLNNGLRVLRAPN